MIPTFLSLSVALSLLAPQPATQGAQGKGTYQKSQPAQSINIQTTNSEQWFKDSAFQGATDVRIDYSDPQLASRRILVTTNMNPKTTNEVIAKLFYLDDRDPNKPIDLWLRTNGGFYNDAFAIIDAMHTIHAPVNVRAIGGCWSAGALILASATGRRYATPHTQLMIHTNAAKSAKPGEFTEDAVDIERVTEILKTKTKIPPDWFPLISGKEYYLSVTQALKYGVIDEIR